VEWGRGKNHFNHWMNVHKSIQKQVSKVGFQWRIVILIIIIIIITDIGDQIFIGEKYNLNSNCQYIVSQIQYLGSFNTNYITCRKKLKLLRTFLFFFKEENFVKANWESYEIFRNSPFSFSSWNLQKQLMNY
jgi:hypothetical protein